LTARLNLEQLRKQAKERLRERRAAGEHIKLSDVQYELAREHGFASWSKLRTALDDLASQRAPSARRDAARAALLDWLARPAVPWEFVGGPEATTSSGRRTGLYTRGHSDAPAFTADLDSLEFLKEREILGVHFVVLSFDSVDIYPDRGRMSVQGVFRVEVSEQGGWRVSSPFGANPVQDVPKRTRPWVNLAGSGGPRRFFWSGIVHPGGSEIAGVRLSSSSGLQLEDDTEARWVIFFTDQQIEWPVTIELLDPRGALVETHEWGEEFA
jgi:hypothetical protein